MTRKARTWAAAAALLLLASGGALAFGKVTGTLAIFNAVSENQNNVLVGGWVPKPSGTGSSASTSSPYSTANLTWTPGANPPVTSQTLKYADGGSGSSASCPSAGSGSYGAFSTPAAGSNSASVTGNNIADWWCFEINSVDGNWTTDFVTFPGVRLFVPTSIVFGPTGTTSGQADNGDTITITANQTLPGSPGTIPVVVCSSGRIEIWSSACGTAGSIGEITGLTITSNVSFPNSSTSVSGSTFTITLGGGSTRDPVSGTGSFTAGPVAVSGSGQQACTATPACSVSSSGHF